MFALPALKERVEFHLEENSNGVLHGTNVSNLSDLQNNWTSVEVQINIMEVGAMFPSQLQAKTLFQQMFQWLQAKTLLSQMLQ